MKKIAIIALIIIGIYFGSRLLGPSTGKPQVTTNRVEDTYNLPSADWKIINTTDKLVLEMEKQTQGYKPQVGLIISSLPESEKDFAGYTKNLVAGLKSTLPKFKISSSALSEVDGFSVFDLIGSYQGQPGQINVIQKLYSKDKSVYTLTGSFTAESSTAEEINQVFAGIYDQQIKSK